MKKTYVTPEVECINFYSEEVITAEITTSLPFGNGTNPDSWDTPDAE